MLHLFLACTSGGPAADGDGSPTAPVDGAPVVVINEVAPVVARSNGGREWVELYAATDEDVDLAGYHLVHAGAAPLPLSGTLRARGHLVLEGELGLDGDGDEVALVDPAGRASRVSFGDTWTDEVWARSADGCDGDCWAPVWLGTPGTTNGLAAVSAADLDWSAPTDAAAFFEVDAASVTALDLAVTTADGIEVFVDGEEVLRDHLPGGTLDPGTPPLGARAPATTLVRIGPEVLLPGTTHVLAVRLHPALVPGALALSLGVRGPTSPAVPPPAAEAVVEGLPEATGTLLEPSRIHAVSLELGPEAIAALEQDTDTYVPGVLTVDGQRVDGVTVRRRGKGGSRRPMTGKPKLRVDLTPGGAMGPYRGLGALLLDNLVQDCSGIKMPVTYALFRGAGNPAPRVGYARLVIDGEDKGLYALTEELDARFAEDAFGDPDALVVDGSYSNEPGEPLTFADFRWESLASFDVEEGDPATPLLADVTAALDAWEQGAATWPDLDAVLDRGAWLRHFAAEQWVGHVDGYVLMPNNYWLVAPADGRVRPVAWDADQAFVRDHEWFIGTRWTAPGGRLAQRCRADAACAAEWEVTLDTLEAHVDALGLPALVDALDALTLPDALDDPHRECAAESVVPARDHVRWWLANRTAELEAGGG